MIVKGTKQLGNFKRGINLYVPKKRTVVLRVVIFGAGTVTSNGEYVWDGGSVGWENKPAYFNGFNSITYNFDNTVAYWSLYDEVIGDSAYRSNDLITWTIDYGEPEAPTSTLFYTP